MSAPAVEPDEEMQRIAALTQLYGRMGAKKFELRLVEPLPDEIQIHIWLALMVTATGEDAAAGPTPRVACERLADQLMDGGRCTNCGRMTGVDHDFTHIPAFVSVVAGVMPSICWYRYDPELNTYRASCEGQT